MQNNKPNKCEELKWWGKWLVEQGDFRILCEGREVEKECLHPSLKYTDMNKKKK